MSPIDEVMEVANSFPAWLTNGLLVAIVFVQAAILARLVMKHCQPFGVSQSEIKTAFRAGLVSTIGPAISIFLTGVGLMSQIGTPLAVARLSVIGNVMYETFAAAAGATASGVQLGQPNFGPTAYAAAVWTMNIGGALMLWMPLVLVKPFSDVKEKVESKGKGMGLGAMIGMSAALGSFACVVVGNIVAGRPQAIASIASALSMFLMVTISKRFRMPWLRQWALGLAMVCGMAAATILKG